MLKLSEKITGNRTASTTLTLPLAQRIKSRVKVTLDDGREAGVFLDRGDALKNGDQLKAENGEIVTVIAAAETVSTIRSNDPLMLARASYHLGNRHVALQISEGMLRYQHDHVLDDMLRGMGLTVTTEQAPFEPEPGAYGSANSGHHHGHAHHSH